MNTKRLAPWLAAALLHGVAQTAESTPSGGSEPRPAVVHSIAEVNDPLSHGVVGDGLLSVNEAIQLHNRTLLPMQLSLGELAQLSGAGSDIAWINIDASSVPTITVERDFDVIQDWPHGFLLQGYNGDAEIDFTGPGVQHGFRSTSNFCSWRNLILRGGPYGIDIQQTDASFGGTVLDHVSFVGQAQFGCRVVGTSTNGFTRLLLTRCAFDGTPTPVVVDDSPLGRTGVFVCFDSEIRNAASGLDVLAGSGGALVAQIERTSIECNGTAVAVRRAPGSDRSAQVSIVQLRAVAQNGLLVAGAPAGVTSVEARMLTMRCAAGEAVSAGSVGAGVDVVVEDSDLAGAVRLVGGGVGGNVYANNLRAAGPSVQLGSSGAPVRMRGSRLDGCGLTTVASAPVAVEDTSIVGGAVQAGGLAPIAMTRCYAPGSWVGSVTSTTPAAAVALGRLGLTPFGLLAGGTVQVTTDVPANCVGFLVVGWTAQSPLLLNPDLHVYLDLGAAVTLPGLLLGSAAQGIPIPNDPAFWGTDWTVQLAVLAGQGSQSPPLQAPPGHRFVVR
ncbi:MAG: hypothetical protein RLZZ562_452 [Planctomycetota bacterium]|jgi:hypothetical protein